MATFFENCVISAMQEFIKQGYSEDEYTSKAVSAALKIRQIISDIPKPERKPVSPLYDEQLCNLILSTFSPSPEIIGSFMTVENLRIMFNHQPGSKKLGYTMKYLGFISGMKYDNNVKKRGYWVKYNK